MGAKQTDSVNAAAQKGGWGQGPGIPQRPSLDGRMGGWADGLRDYVKVGRGMPLTSDEAPPSPNPQSHHLCEELGLFNPSILFIFGIL